MQYDFQRTGTDYFLLRWKEPLEKKTTMVDEQTVLMNVESYIKESMKCEHNGGR